MRYKTYSPVFDRSFHLLPGLRVKSDVARAIDQAIVLDGLGELREGFRSVLREDAFDLAHLECENECAKWVVGKRSRLDGMQKLTDKNVVLKFDIHQERLPSARYRAGAESGHWYLQGLGETLRASDHNLSF